MGWASKIYSTVNHDGVFFQVQFSTLSLASTIHVGGTTSKPLTCNGTCGLEDITQKHRQLAIASISTFLEGYQ